MDKRIPIYQEADRLANAEVEDRAAVERVGADDEDRVGVVDVADLGGDLWLREADEGLAGRAAGRARIHMRRPERLSHDALDQVALLVGGVADDRRHPTTPC